MLSAEILPRDKCKHLLSRLSILRKEAGLNNTFEDFHVAFLGLGEDNSERRISLYLLGMIQKVSSSIFYPTLANFHKHSVVGGIEDFLQGQEIW